MKTIFLLLCVLAFSGAAMAQLKLGSVRSQINFREGPGLNYKVNYSIDNSNLLVIMPGEAKNNFVEVFDIETSSYGFVAENLISVVDTLYMQKQKYFEHAGENQTGEIEVELINKTSNTLFVWINKITYSLVPFEKKCLVLPSEDITFFSSAPGLFPVFGKEVLMKGSLYRWVFTL